ncbi:PREDICTED: cysteine dioxygenase type 1 [Papilio xuthus]|uniref:Cysteine dioxygenase n=1 Tax=Papilio xuthus TaxID=66420 RepID=A0A194PV81_PAPXU|nr:PREDICTED: cysteine dioxygenase type 1 [Papilio xuthus]KPI96664.1 Cysteine dioxygenase type 1 [Papilio xuthus]
MEVESANCKVRVSQCDDLDMLAVERPLKIDIEINGLEMLVQELHNVFSRDHVNVQDVQKLMAAYKSEPKDWKKYAKFDRFRYTRNLVDAGNGAFNIMVLCWGPGHASAIHDHADSHCFMKILSGSLEEVRYEWPNNVEPEVLKKLKTKNSCCSANEIATDDRTSDLIYNCQNDTCPNFRGKSDSMEHSEQDGDQDYDANKMEEIGRTALEVNDVCYINDALGLHRMENPSYVDGAVSLHLYCPPFDSCRMFDARTGKPTDIKVTFWSMYGKKVKRVIEANDIVDSQE